MHISFCTAQLLYRQVKNGKIYFFLNYSWEDSKNSFRGILNRSKMLLPLEAKCRTSTNPFGQFTLV